jgi:NodT family efflux transporter outer membrane factor (OMF) lipoprotein
MKPVPDGSALARLLAATCVLTAAACASAPPYQPPATTAPSAYKETAPPESLLGTAWKVAEPQNERVRPNWWEMFGDPALNALEARVAKANPTVAEAEATFRAARAALRAANADLYPTVGATGSVSATRQSANRGTITTGGGTGTVPITTGSAGGTINDYLAQADVSYTPDISGKVRGTIRAQAASAQAAAADLENTLLTLQQDLAVDYVSLRGIDEQIRLLRDATESYDHALQLTINRRDQGVASGADVAQARTQLETTRAQTTDLAIGRAQMEHAIAVLTGQMPAAVSVEVSTTPLTPPVVPVGLPSDLLERRPDIAGAERRVAAANAQIGVAHAAFFPTLTLSGSGGFESSALTTIFDWPSRVWSLGAALAQTIFDGGKRRAQTDQAVAVYDETAAAYRQSVLQAFQQVEDTLAELRILAEEAAEQQAAVAAAEQSLTIANNQYQGGITTYLEVITAQNVALTNERTAADLKTRQLTASVQLVAALGGGWSVKDLPTVR